MAAQTPGVGRPRTVSVGRSRRPASGPQGSDRTARAELIESHLPLARHLVRLFENRGESIDDLMQVASIGLIRAADRFDPALGFEFSTFATETVLGELKRHFRDRMWAVKTPRTMQERFLEVSATIEQLGQSLGRAPSVLEVAEVCGRTADEVVAAIEAGRGYRASSLESHPVEAKVLWADEPHEPGSLSDRDELRTYLAVLPSRSQQILELRFVDELSQSDIAERLGISQMHVSRLLRQALNALRVLYGVRPGQ